MLENSFGLTFFLKTPRKKTNHRFIHLRITADGTPKETSTKRKWDLKDDTTYHTYDNQGRLTVVKDHFQRAISENTYHFKP